jgi:LEA14-like dessication related protein
MRRIARVRFLMLVLMLSPMLGCAGLSQLVESPKVSLTNVALVQAGLLEQRYRLTLRVQNPNPVSVPVNGLDYAVKLAGIEFAQGVTPNAFTLPANGEDTVDIEVSMNLLESAQQLYKVFKAGPENLDYQLSGNISVDLPFVKSVPFSKSGQVNIKGFGGI